MLELRSQAPDDDPDEPQPKAVPRKILSILKPTNKYWGTGPARPVQDQRGHRSYPLSKYIESDFGSVTKVVPCPSSLEKGVKI